MVYVKVFSNPYVTICQVIIMTNKLIPHPESAVEAIDGRCNALMRSCRSLDADGNQCDYQYQDVTEMECGDCGAPRKRCHNFPSTRGNSGRCRFHGGNTPSGIASPNYKGRGYSKNLPTRMLEYYQNAIDDPDLLNMSPDISLLVARVEELKSRTNTDTSYTYWQKVREAFAKHAKARKNPNKPGALEMMKEALEEMEENIIRGSADSAIWKEIMAVEEQIRKTKASEIKRRQAAESIITEQQFRTLMGFIVTSIQTRVKDDTVKMQILGDLASLKM